MWNKIKSWFKKEDYALTSEVVKSLNQTNDYIHGQVGALLTIIDSLEARIKALESKPQTSIIKKSDE